MTENQQLTALLAACHWIGDKGWCPATGGNMSLRTDERQCPVTESGKDKGSLSATDFLRVDIADNHVPSGRTPSAETGLHTLLYRLSAHIGAVLHTHSVNATVLSRVERGDALVLQGYEMQKSLAGQRSHRTAWRSPFSITIRISLGWRRAWRPMPRARRCNTAFWYAATACIAGERWRKPAAISKGWNSCSSVNCNAAYWRRNDPRYRDRY